jgi:2-keto-3-deoxy-L-fuconate dehydrogenase
MSDPLQGLRVLVTGGAAGIGAAVVDHFRSARAAVAVLDLTDPQRDDVVFVQADLADDVSVASAVASAINQLGGLDVLVNNAGIGAQGGVEDNTDDEWHHVLDVDVIGPVRVTRAALPALRQSPHASIVMVGSIVAAVGLPQRALYSAAKGGVVALGQAIAADLLADGIRVNVVNPGTADTPWIDRLLASADDPVATRRALEQRQPHGRLVSPAEVAAAIGYLASPTSGSTTGAVLAVDGGVTGLRLPPRTT